jgi:sulfate adenylyltransferase subunit 1 (EFTu-like GTPase family)
VDFGEEAFLRVRDQFMTYAERLDSVDVQFVPMAALHGDNVVEKSPRMPWYAGSSLLYTLESVYVRNDVNHVDARFPVQTVIRPQDASQPDFRGFAGQVASGVFRPGEEILHLSTGLTARIKAIHGPTGPVAAAFHPMSVVLELDRELDISRGDMLARPNNQPAAATGVEVMCCWLGNQALDPQRAYLLRHTTRELRCRVAEIRYKLDVVTLHRSAEHSPVQMNDLARLRLTMAAPLHWDPYRKIRQTGAILLVDEFTHATIAAGMML